MSTEDAPNRATPRPKKGAGYGWIIGIIVAVGALLVVQSSFSSGRYSLELQAVQEEPEKFLGREVKIVGNIKEGSTRHTVEDGKQITHFVIHDGKGHELAVRYPHVVPDPYKEGRECIVEGVLASRGQVDCTKLTVKCPSKYQSEDGGDSPADYYKDKYKQPTPPAGGPST